MNLRLRNVAVLVTSCLLMDSGFAVAMSNSTGLLGTAAGLQNLASNPFKIQALQAELVVAETHVMEGSLSPEVHRMAAAARLEGVFHFLNHPELEPLDFLLAGYSGSYHHDTLHQLIEIGKVLRKAGKKLETEEDIIARLIRRRLRKSEAPFTKGDYIRRGSAISIRMLIQKLKTVDSLEVVPVERKMAALDRLRRAMRDGTLLELLTDALGKRPHLWQFAEKFKWRGRIQTLSYFHPFFSTDADFLKLIRYLLDVTDPARHRQPGDVRLSDQSA